MQVIYSRCRQERFKGSPILAASVRGAINSAVRGRPVLHHGQESPHVGGHAMPDGADVVSRVGKLDVTRGSLCLGTTSCMYVCICKRASLSVIGAVSSFSFLVHRRMQPPRSHACELPDHLHLASVGLNRWSVPCCTASHVCPLLFPFPIR